MEQCKDSGRYVCHASMMNMDLMVSMMRPAPIYFFIKFSPDKGVAFSLQLFSVKESGGVAFAANAASMTAEHGVQCSAGRRIFSQEHQGFYQYYLLCHSLAS